MGPYKTIFMAASGAAVTQGHQMPGNENTGQPATGNGVALGVLRLPAGAHPLCAAPVPAERFYSRRFLSIKRKIIGVKINCMASPIFPPGITKVFGRVIQERSIIESR